MKLTKIAIENFKGIRDRVEIPLRPITLLFGANSVGKSTVLQALLYFRDLLEHENANADRLLASGAAVDLGGFRQFVHKHDLSLPVRVEVSFVPDDDGLPVYPVAGVGDGGALLSALRSLGSVSLGIEVRWDDSTNRPWITEYRLGVDGMPVGRIQANPNFLAELAQLDLTHPLFKNEEESNEEESEVLTALRTLITGVALPNASIGEGVALPLGKSVIPKWGIALPLPFDLELSPSPEETWSQIPLAQSVLSSLFVGSGELIWKELQRLRYIGPLRSVPNRGFLARCSPSSERWADGSAAWDILHRSAAGIESPELLEKVSDTISDPRGLNLGYQLEGRHFYELPAKGFVVNLLTSLSHGAEDENVEDRLSLILQDIRSQPQRTHLSLIDVQKETEVTPADIGAGITQVVPIVVGAMEPQAGIVVVEQPELHTHPAVQCALGDIFVREVSGDSGRIFLIETHSEHLLLRLMKRIRLASQGEALDSRLALAPDDISIVFVENYQGRAVFREMPLNERGELVKAWPGGFFEEDLAEVM